MNIRKIRKNWTINSIGFFFNMISHFTSVHTNAIVSGEKLSQNFMFKISCIYLKYFKINLLSCMKYHYVQSCVLFSKCSVFWQCIVGDMKNAQTLSLIKKQTSRFQNTKIKIKGKMGDTELLLSLQCKRTHLVFCRY